MKIPLSWLENYIKLEHTPKEFADIMTSLGFMLDAPIENVGGTDVLDIDAKTNRPDVLSIIGTAREYAAYVNKPVQYPEQLSELPIEVTQPEKLFKVDAKQIVKRFFAIEIKDIKVKKSPEHIAKALEAYGIPVMNNIIDITNYVMLEYGVPMHAFDLDKLPQKNGQPLLKLRMADEDKEEKLTTWLEEEITATSEDLVVADSSERLVSIGGITGEAQSGITKDTKNIILEAANYDHAHIRRTSVRHNLFNESSSRHSKILPSDVVEIAIMRALKLIQELAGGEIVTAEDFYEEKEEPKTVEFNLYEIDRLGGIQIEVEEVQQLLERLEFEVVEQQEAIGLNKNIFLVRVPKHRTDIQQDADLVEEVLRLWGYSNIPARQIATAPPDYSTPKHIDLEEKMRDILVSLQLDEHITMPLVQFDEAAHEQIKLENPLNSKQDGLRTSIRATLTDALTRAQKAGHNKIALFEVGKIYLQKRVGDYQEVSKIETLYSGYDFKDKVKPDLLAVFDKLGLESGYITWQDKADSVDYLYKSDRIAVLHANGYELFTKEIAEIVDLDAIPYSSIETTLVQNITEQISVVTDKGNKIGNISDAIESASDYIKKVDLTEIYEDAKLGKNKVSATFSVLYEDAQKQMTRKEVEDTKKVIEKSLSKLKAKLRS